jgi:hypothetical protein
MGVLSKVGVVELMIKHWAVSLVISYLPTPSARGFCSVKHRSSSGKSLILSFTSILPGLERFISAASPIPRSNSNKAGRSFGEYVAKEDPKPVTKVMGKFLEVHSPSWPIFHLSDAK